MRRFPFATILTAMIALAPPLAAQRPTGIVGAYVPPATGPRSRAASTCCTRRWRSASTYRTGSSLAR